MRLPLILAATLAFLSVPAVAEDDDHVTKLGELRLLHGWARATEGDTTQVYFEIEHNGTTPATLTSATTEIADMAAIFGAPIQAEGEPVALGTFPLVPGEEFDLSPDSVFILLKGLQDHLDAGDHFDMVVEIAPFGTAELHVEVEDADADNHSHAGHNH